MVGTGQPSKILVLIFPLWEHGKIVVRGFLANLLFWVHRRCSSEIPCLYLSIQSQGTGVSWINFYTFTKNSAPKSYYQFIKNHISLPQLHFSPVFPHAPSNDLKHTYMTTSIPTNDLQTTAPSRPTLPEPTSISQLNLLPNPLRPQLSRRKLSSHPSIHLESEPKPTCALCQSPFHPSKESYSFPSTAPVALAALGKRFTLTTSSSCRFFCHACWIWIHNLSICWTCGDTVTRGEERVSYGWCWWHWGCVGCLFCRVRFALPPSCPLSTMCFFAKGFQQQMPKN